MCSLAVLGARSLDQDVSRAIFLPRLGRILPGPFQLLVVAGGPWCSSVHAASLRSLPPSSHGRLLPPCVSLSSHDISCLMRTLVTLDKAHLEILS